MSEHATVEKKLLDAYEAIIKEKGNAPEWAVHKRNAPEELVRPTIPFVGKNYAEQPKKILVYASAENLADYWKGNDNHWKGDWLDDDVQATNRHRKCFDDQMMQPASSIPYVHCGPMETGLLLTAAMYIAEKLGALEPASITPRAFCESICFGNYGKFSKETPYQTSRRKGNNEEEAKQNIDYAGNMDLMKASHDYIKADIETLKPDYIILPATMYSAAKSFVDGIKGNAKIVPIHQMLAANVNNYIAPNQRMKKVYKKYTPEELSPAVRVAYNDMTTVSLDKYLYVFGYLDEVLVSLKK